MAILFCYLVYFFLILRFCVTLFNFISNPKLTKVSRQYHDLVSILVPARDEEKNILTLLQSIEKQDYKNIEVIVLDDQSTDHTYNLCTEFARKNPTVKVIIGKPLPEGWLGKNYACYQLAQQAKGKYLLFLDADEEIYNGLINSAVYRTKVHRLALLSLFTNQVMVTLGETLVVPLMHYMLLNLLPLRLIYLSKNPAFAAASGQFMFFDAEKYRGHQWHQKVKDQVVEDVEIMKCVKQNRLKGEGLLANGLIRCRMYNNYQEAVHGFSKNFLAPFNYSIITFLLYLFFLIGGPIIVGLTLNLQLFLMMVSLIVLTRIMISLESGQNPFYNMLLHPLQMVSLVIIAHLSIKKHLTKTVTWKGRKV
ncbi:glycosyltransferase [Mucilaginibacter arboris]|uniref:Glycosyltransferase n=1 Tax=Mucilaginibacter arboris TaxID=2682090 RepID=A0A7K1T0Y0_9SPHI|nr:glycosyltransferase family 2 protein [Mucilaginibacter arboris]MVN23226.1 glycosyltransferase [Mucilaginibacter arboris]